LTFVVGEGQIPISMLMDPHCEELAFPTIWYGHERSCPEGCKLSYEDHVNSEVRRRDRRAVRPDHLLYVNRKCQLKQFASKINVVMKISTQTTRTTASQALDKDFIDDAVGKDNAYRFTSSITGTPGYWEHQKKNVLAMVQQNGIFTFFVTLSAAESQWLELLKMLKRTIDKENDADVSNMSSAEKCRLIRSDPVTCAMYFDHRFKELMKTWHNTDEGPFGKNKIVHKYYRIEFQQRGSPHVHMILWVDGAPVFDPGNPENFAEICDFIDQFVSTSSDDPEIEQFMKYQRHKCTHTCKKTLRGKVTCRFGFPFPPMERTMILMPLPDDYEISQEMVNQNRELSVKMKEILIEQDCSLATMDEFLNKMGITMDRYILFIRSQLKSNKIFVKRLPKDSRVNQYNKKIIMLMRSNMDFQYVLDAYACVQYIVDYINKSQRGLSKLVRDCVEDFRRGNHSLREKLKAVANVMYNGSEISAQEAAWCRLRLPMSSCSTIVEFINTGPSNVSK
jgi:Helitron helicase-like domain at N-terminus